MNYAFAATSAIIGVFCLFILKKPKKTWADLLLIAINVLIALFLLSEVLVQQELTSFSTIFQNTVPLFLFPMFTTYAFEFIRESSTLRKYRLLLFVPGLLFIAFGFTDHYLLNNYPTQEALLEHYTTPHPIYHVFFKGSQLMFIGVLAYLLRRVYQFDDALKAQYSYVETVGLKWIRNFMWIYITSIAMSFVLFSLSNLGWISLNIPAVFGIIYGSLVVSVFYMNVEGIRHYTIAQEFGDNALPLNIEEVEQVEAASETKKSESDTNPRLQEIHQKILQLFEEEKPYLMGKYGLKDLSADIGESSHLTSEAINSLEKKNFYEFVNEFRVNALKGLLEDPKNQQFTIIHLGFESGFNSKASMNRIFKQFTGTTPKLYLSGLS